MKASNNCPVRLEVNTKLYTRTMFAALISFPTLICEFSFPDIPMTQTELMKSLVSIDECPYFLISRANNAALCDRLTKVSNSGPLAVVTRNGTSFDNVALSSSLFVLSLCIENYSFELMWLVKVNIDRKVSRIFEQ